MKVINYSELRLNLRKWLDAAVDDSEEIIITRKYQKNAVLISMAGYISLQETVNLLSGRNRESILRALEEAKFEKE